MTRSWWGWGAVDEAVVGAEADELVARASALLPGHDFTDHPPPDPVGLVGPPRVSAPAALEHLCAADPVVRAGHARGKAFRDVVRNLLGRFEHVPDLVVFPEREDDVVDVLDWCSRAGIAVVPYGGGSSVVGGVEPRFAGPSVSLDLSRLDRVLEVDRVSRAARVQAGVFGPALEDQLRPHGLTLRHFPQSFAHSTVGGWLATRAAGHFATLRTRIDHLTEALRVVTPTGTSESGRFPGSGAGPSPDALFLGSEGALGVITEAWLRLQDRPRWRLSTSVAFADHAAAVEATREVAQSGLHPANCRLLDGAEAFLNTGARVGGLLLLAFESADQPVDAALDRAVEIAAARGGTAGERREGAWRSSFLRMPYQRDALARRSMVVETFETACTWSAFPALDAAVRAAAPGLITCRFTHVYPDGPAPYYGVYASGRWGSTHDQWDDIKAAVSEAILAGGGTITHHHAVGRDHRPWYDRQRPDPFARALRAAKAELDPAGILNPGVLV
ncbi:FAD-binding oxidoreductase [Actinokineospora soli]